MSDQTRFQTALADDPLFAKIIEEGKQGQKRPGYDKNHLVTPATLSTAQQKQLEDWGL